MIQAYMMTEWVDRETGAKGYLVIDELKGGFCAGGIRMYEGVTQDEVKRLAEIMTAKMAGLGQSIGGAKGGIDFPANVPESRGVLKRYLQAHIPFIKDCWLTSEDLGTREEDLVTLLRELGLVSTAQAFIEKQEDSSVHMQELQKATMTTYDGMPLTDVVTGYGIAVVTMKAMEHIGLEKNATVSIQGFGSVGASSAKFLDENGIKVTAVADVKGTIYSETGLDIALLMGAKDERGLISRESLPANYELLDDDAWLQVDADILIPAAIADVINGDNVGEINPKLIVEAANIPVTEEAEKQLFDRQILVIPDFIANSGGAGLFVSVLGGGVKGEAEAIFAFLKKEMEKTIEHILQVSQEQNIVPRQAAKSLVAQTP